MLPKINRIKKKKDFDIIFKNAKNFKSDIFILKFLKNKVGLKRFGVVVSSKVSKKAVVRNKIRRILTEIIKLELNNIQDGTDLLIITIPGINKKSFLEIKNSLIGALLKLKLIDKY